MTRTATVHVAVWTCFLVYFATICADAMQENRTMHELGSGTGQPGAEELPSSPGPSAPEEPPATEGLPPSVVFQPKAGTVRLSGGTNSSGRLEIFLRGEWGTVCEESFTPEAVHVTCRQLGLTAGVSFHPGAEFGTGMGKIWLNDVECLGTEGQLLDCDIWSIGDIYCTHSQDIGVTCGPPAPDGPPASEGPPPPVIYLPKEGTVRLTNGTNSSGRLEIFLRGEWGTVCDEYFSLGAAQVACKQLGFPIGRSFHPGAAFGNGTGKIWLHDVDCVGTESQLLDCDLWSIGDNECGHNRDIGITCAEVNQGVRFSGGSKNNSGVFELVQDGRGEPFCGSSMQDFEAEIACREMGFEKPVALGCRTRLPYQGSSSALREVWCYGDETELANCNAGYGDSRTCLVNKEATGVCGVDGLGSPSAIQDVRLSGGSSNRGGRVEVLVSGSWVGLMAKLWDKPQADLICHQLGFGDHLSLRSSALPTPPAEYTWLRILDCDGGEKSTLSECATETYYTDREGHCNLEPATVICGRNITRVDQDAIAPGSCTSATPNAMTGDSAAHSAIDMVFFIDLRDKELVYVAEWVEWFLPILDLQLADTGFGSNSSCGNMFSLVIYEDNPGYQVFSTDNTTQYFHSIENFLIVIEHFYDDWSVRSVPPTLKGVHAALDDVIVGMRPSTRSCLVARNVVVMSSVTFPYPGDEDSATLEEQLRKNEITLHTFLPGNSFRISSIHKGIGRTINTGYADFSAKTCSLSTPLSQPIDSVGEPMSNISTAALNVGGSVWELILPPSGRIARSCAFQEVITDQLNRRIASCFYCLCSSFGQENCVLAASEEEECRCEAKGGKLHEGLCVAAAPTTSEDLTPTPNHTVTTVFLGPEQATSSSMLTAIAASLSVTIAATLLVVVIVLVRKKKKQQQKQHSEAQQDSCRKEKDRRLPSVTAASHHMMTMLAAPASPSLKIIPNELLTFVRCIGKGQFGEVHLGGLQVQNHAEQSQNAETKVAIKIVPDANASEENTNALLEEYFLQQVIGEHPNIVKFLLGGLFKGQACIVMEYMDGGDLHGFLKNIKGSQQLSYSHAMSLKEVEKLDIASQIALGLEFLASKKIVHRDIAARNILLQEHRQLRGKLIAKISDWGLSRRIAVEGMYQAQTERMLPMKWMSIESIADGTFTEKSDVWSFGVLLWELASLGDVPYSGTPNALLLQILQKGTRLERPSQCSLAMFSVMSRCWKEDPNDRPTFEFLSKDLTFQLENEANYITVLEEIEDIPGAVNAATAAATDHKAPSCQHRTSVIPLALEKFRQDSFDTREGDNKDSVRRGSFQPAADWRSLHEQSCDSVEEPLDAASRYVTQPVKPEVTLPSSTLHSVPAPSIQE